jgi:hypothetical protein
MRKLTGRFDFRRTLFGDQVRMVEETVDNLADVPEAAVQDAPALCHGLDLATPELRGADGFGPGRDGRIITCGPRGCASRAQPAPVPVRRRVDRCCTPRRCGWYFPPDCISSLRLREEARRNAASDDKRET